MNADDPDDVAVSDMLRTAAVEHEPDRDRVVRRLGFDPASGAAPARVRTVSTWSPGAPRRARMLPVGVAAAAAVVVTGVALLVTTNGNHPVAAPEPTTVTGAPPMTTSAASTPTATVTPSLIPPAPAPSRSPAAPPARATNASGPVGTAGVPNGTVVDLGGDRDWAAVVRPDGTVVRPKVPQLGPLDVRWTGAVADGASPYRVSWSAGSPEQDRTGATTWLAIGAGGSVTVTVPALPRSATVELYLGARRADVVVSGAARASWSHQGGDVGAVVVTIAVPASAAPTTFTVGATRVAPGGTVGLAAVTLA